MKKFLIFTIISFILISGISYADNSMLIWEAYAKGLVEIITTHDSIGFIVINKADFPVVIDDYVMLLSPNPVNPTSKTTQDGMLVKYTIPAKENKTFYYASYTVFNGYYNPFINETPWWCSELWQFTRANTLMVLGGQIAPIKIQEFIEDPNKTDANNNSIPDLDEWYGPGGNTRSYNIWFYLDNYSSIVIGKTPLFKESVIGEKLEITLWITNIGRMDANVEIIDEIPNGFYATDFSIEPYKNDNKLKWNLDVEGYDNNIDPDEIEPLQYVTKKITYNLIPMKTGRIILPEAKAKWNDGIGLTSSYSAKPILEISSDINDLIKIKEYMFEIGWIDNKGVLNSLDVKLEHALKHIEKEEYETAKNNLQAFINEVEAQNEKHIIQG
ncbi:MAG: hypothetical protein ACE5J4_03560, partial [Candidatus Aenigmatarchaeota archaeon]